MLEYLCLFVLLFTSLIGILSILGFLFDSMPSKKYTINEYIVIPMSMYTEDIEYMLRTKRMQGNTPIILLNMGLPSDDLESIKKISLDFKYVFIMNKDELSDGLYEMSCS